MADSLPAIIARRIEREYIETPAAAVGDKLPSFRALRAEYGASNTTIAHALSILEARGVIEKRHGSGSYVRDAPDRGAGSLAGTLGLVLDGQPSHSTAVRAQPGVAEAAETDGRHVLTALSGGAYESERRQVERLAAAGCPGIVVCPTVRTEEELAADYLTCGFRNTPIVLIDLAYPVHGRTHVLFDNYRAGLHMTRLLLEAGRRRIAFMKAGRRPGRLRHRSNEERLRGYGDALRAAGLPLRDDDLWTYYLLEDDGGPSPYEMLEAWKQAPERPDALIALEDSVAMACLEAAADLGIDIPGDLAVVGFDNVQQAQGGTLRFPTTEADFRWAGTLAAELLLEHLGGKGREPFCYVLPVPLVVPEGWLA